MPRRIPSVAARTVLCALVASAVFTAPSAAQTIQGSLIDLDTNAPIPLGLVLMYTEAGDSVTSTISDGAGRFTISAAEAGSYMLNAAALGYAETPAGVFELGDDGSMTIEYRLRPAPLPIDALLVSVDRPVLDHHLVRNGYVRRLQRGLGKFITPYDIENSPAPSTESLMQGIPSVRVGMVRANGLYMPHIGETVQIANPLGGWCDPTFYVDGIRIHYDPLAGTTISQYVTRQDVEAIEVYRRPAEIPVEFGVSDQGTGGGGTGLVSGPRGCGVVVLWSKRGLATGQRPASDLDRVVASESGSLPEVDKTGGVVEPGELIRVAISATEAERIGIDRLWQGTFVTTSANAAVVEEPATGRPVAIPTPSIETLQVSRLKPQSHAYRRGARNGALFAAGVWGFLEFLCAFTCGARADQETLLPALAGGAVVGFMDSLRGPGREWVEAPLPATGGAPGGGLSLSLSIPTGRH